VVDLALSRLVVLEDLISSGVEATISEASVDSEVSLEGHFPKKEDRKNRVKMEGGNNNFKNPQIELLDLSI